MPKWELKRTTQCAKCPWRESTDPREIPNGYCETKHRNLKGTIADPGDLHTVFSNSPLRVMACHEDEEAHCIGWLMHQIGRGNNIALRLHVRSCTNMNAVRLVGPQHKRFEDTLPCHEE